MIITAVEVKNAFKRSAYALRENSEFLVELDQQLGDGDLGITARKIADALDDYIALTQDEMDIGKWVMSAGMKINSAAPSTMGSLLAIALMRAGKTAKDQTEINEATLVAMLEAGANAILEKGKANLGDKTILDALIPGVKAFAESMNNGESMAESGKKMLAAAEAGMESATPLRSKVGRASWVGDRTEGKVDPGCALWVCVLKAVIG